MTKKAGCFLINKETKQIALIYREKQNDYSFPKGHLEDDETLEECAIRETAEETKRDGIVLKEYEPIIETYTTPKGEECICYMYIALDKGPSTNTSTDTHTVIWTDIDKVEETLSYPSLKNTWNEVKDNILDYINKQN